MAHSADRPVVQNNALSVWVKSAHDHWTGSLFGPRGTPSLATVHSNLLEFPFSWGYELSVPFLNQEYHLVMIMMLTSFYLTTTYYYSKVANMYQNGGKFRRFYSMNAHFISFPCCIMWVHVKVNGEDGSGDLHPLLICKNKWKWSCVPMLFSIDSKCL